MRYAIVATTLATRIRLYSESVRKHGFLYDKPVASCGEMALNLYRVWNPVKMTKNRVVYQNKNSMAAMRSI